jgi:hypothetical protein
MSHDERSAALAEIGAELAARGYVTRQAPYFANNGIVAFSQPVATWIDTPRGRQAIDVIERSVALYATEGRFEARVTQHGGPHWVKAADTPEELQALALDALEALEIPPAGWLLEPGWSRG